MITLVLVSLLLSIPVARGKGRAQRAHAPTIRFLAQHTNSILAKKCRPTYSSLRGTWPQWRRRHRLAHRAKKGTCLPWSPAWYREAMCIHHYEGAFNADTGNGYGGGFQFLVSTWNRAAARSRGRVPFVSSTSQIAGQSPTTQLYAAWLVYLQDGHSWREWGTAGMCHLS